MNKNKKTFMYSLYYASSVLEFKAKDAEKLLLDYLQQNKKRVVSTLLNHESSDFAIQFIAMPDKSKEKKKDAYDFFLITIGLYKELTFIEAEECVNDLLKPSIFSKSEHLLTQENLSGDDFTLKTYMLSLIHI